MLRDIFFRYSEWRHRTIPISLLLTGKPFISLVRIGIVVVLGCQIIIYYVKLYLYNVCFTTCLFSLSVLPTEKDENANGEYFMMSNLLHPFPVGFGSVDTNRVTVLIEEACLARSVTHH